MESQGDYYQILGISASASGAEIKRAYRQLAKQHHPDRQPNPSNPGNLDPMVRINQAYEVLGDRQRRQIYDRQRHWDGAIGVQGVESRHERTTAAQAQYRQKRQKDSSQEELCAAWVQQVYTPVNRLLGEILNPFKNALSQLSADPFDDGLMEEFQAYLEDSRNRQQKAQTLFQKLPNPPQMASLAMNLYYCLNQVGDGLGELERFTLCYDDSYLRDGKEMFRIAQRMRKEVQSQFRQASH